MASAAYENAKTGLFQPVESELDEVEPGAALKTVHRAYRKPLLRYQSDKFANDPEMQKMATEVTRRLTEAYNGLSRYLGGGGESGGGGRSFTSRVIGMHAGMGA